MERPSAEKRQNVLVCYHSPPQEVVHGLHGGVEFLSEEFRDLLVDGGVRRHDVLHPGGEGEELDQGHPPRVAGAATLRAPRREEKGGVPHDRLQLSPIPVPHIAHGRPGRYGAAAVDAQQLHEPLVHHEARHVRQDERVRLGGQQRPQRPVEIQPADAAEDDHARLREVKEVDEFGRLPDAFDHEEVRLERFGQAGVAPRELSVHPPPLHLDVPFVAEPVLLLHGDHAGARPVRLPEHRVEGRGAPLGPRR
ncbi:MAG: hypothetical protein C4529_01560 [Deltaproteobacteria bacterium]|nr:MAG: hypothetical protein C4529_01560 [Deltaproteobacteria bacterium]